MPQETLRKATLWRCCQCHNIWSWRLTIACHIDNHRRCSRCTPVAQPKPREPDIAPRIQQSEELAVHDVQHLDIQARPLKVTTLQLPRHPSDDLGILARMEALKISETSTSLAQYPTEIRNITGSLVYSWLESRHRRPHEGRLQDGPVCSLASGSDDSIRQDRVPPEDKTTQSSKCTERATQKCSKRRVQDIDDTGEDDEDTHKDRRQKLDKSRAQIGKIWACPYWKHDPITYSLQNNCKCSTHLLDSISRLKQHLYRNHKRPDFYCIRCFAVFDTENTLDSHGVQPEPCQRKSSPFQDQITVTQHKALKKKTPKKTQRECWYQIYAILFPDDVLPVSPFLDEASLLQVIVDDLCQYIRVEAPARVSERITAGILQLFPAMESREDSINEIVERAVTHLADLVEARALRREQSRSLNQSGSDSSESRTPELTNGNIDVTGTAAGSGAFNHEEQLAEGSSRRATALHRETNQDTPADQTDDLFTDLPDVPDEFLDFLDFEHVLKSGGAWNNVLPASWAFDS